MDSEVLTAAERRFRVWMYISAWMYAAAGLVFLFAGDLIVNFFNFVTDEYLTMFAPYSLPAEGGEGAFWLVLSLSMMAMITWICRAACLDIRRNGRLVHVLLLSKFCSSVLYLGFFVKTGQMAHLVGFATDFPIFLVTTALWIPAAAGDRYIDETEENVLVAMGETILPRGGAFECGYADFRESCLADARRMFEKQDPAALAVCRAMIRIFDVLPIVHFRRLRTFRRLSPRQRLEFLSWVENNRLSALREMFTAMRMFIVFPFFNNEGAAQAVGFVPAEDAR